MALGRDRRLSSGLTIIYRLISSDEESRPRTLDMKRHVLPRAFPRRQNPTFHAPVPRMKSTSPLSNTARAKSIVPILEIRPPIEHFL